MFLARLQILPLAKLGQDHDNRVPPVTSSQCTTWDALQKMDSIPSRRCHSAIKLGLHDGLQSYLDELKGQVRPRVPCAVRSNKKDTHDGPMRT